MLDSSRTWGTQLPERQLVFPCDGLIAQPDEALFRGLTINASPATVFRWLCQLRVAPYSYDWIDNGGRPSPAELIPQLDKLAPGQEVMRIFELVAFSPGSHLTLRLKPYSPAARRFGELGVSYVVIPAGAAGCRLLVKMIVKYPAGLKGRLLRSLLPWGDLIMMRRQLLNFKRLAEQTR
jgi:hypothetical protein